VTGFIFLIVLFYGAPNPDLNAPVFPLASIYYQITGSAAGSIGLLFVVLVPALLSCIGDYITAGRTLWTLARDDATPFPGLLGKISTTHKNPFNATLFCGVVSTLLGFIYLGSSTAFNAFVSCFILLSTLSYLATIVPFIFTGRFSRAQDGNGNEMAPGPFRMGPLVGYAVNIISCLYMIAFNVIYCFPYTAEVTAANMNYTCLITGGLTIFITVWWLFKRKSYKGPAVRF
jgi:choline transport protein